MGKGPMTATLTGLDEPEQYGSSARTGTSAFELVVPRPTIVRVAGGRGVPRWLPHVLQRLNDLEAALHEPADEARVLPDPQAVWRALRELGGILGDRIPTPSVVPTVDGGVQFAWHKAGWDVEVEVLANETVVWVRRRDEGQGDAGLIAEMRPLLDRALRALESTP